MSQDKDDEWTKAAVFNNILQRSVLCVCFLLLYAHAEIKKKKKKHSTENVINDALQLHL